MKQQYFFFQPDKYRNEYKKSGVIGFNLQAWFTVPGDLSENPFKQLDKIHFWYDSKSPENFTFEVYTGIDSSTVHSENNEKEFLKTFEKDGYKLISERDYLRYRKFALNAFSKYSIDGDNDGEEKYFYSNRTGRYFHEALLIKIRYKKGYYPFNIDNDRIPLKTNYEYDYKIVESNKIFLSKSDKYLCNSFDSQSLGNLLFYNSWELALNGAFSKDDHPVEISYHQYIRLRNLLKSMMVKKSPLEIIKFNKPQDYYNRHSS